MGKQLISDVLAQGTKNPTVTGFISDISEVKEGDNFKRRGCTLTDKSGSIPLILWGDDVNRVEQGKYYTIEKGWLKEYEGEYQLQLGNYGKLLLTDESQMMSAETRSAPKPTLDDHKGNVESTLDDRITRAKKVTEAFIELCKNHGAEQAIVNAASIWNTESMRK